MIRLIRWCLWLPVVLVSAIFVSSNVHLVEWHVWLLDYQIVMPAYILPMALLFSGLILGALWMRLRR